MRVGLNFFQQSTAHYPMSVPKVTCPPGRSCLSFPPGLVQCVCTNYCPGSGKQVGRKQSHVQLELRGMGGILLKMSNILDFMIFLPVVYRCAAVTACSTPVTASCTGRPVDWRDTSHPGIEGPVGINGYQ